MRFLSLQAIAIIVFGAAIAAQAQDRWRLEVLGGVASATEKLAGVAVGTGGGAEANISYRFLPHLSA